MSPFPGKLQVTPFKVSIPDSAIDEFRQLLKLSKIGPATVENTKNASQAMGVSREWAISAKEHWLNKYDWRKTEDRINSFGSYKAPVTLKDGSKVELHFLALQSKKQNAIPVVLLHGWPGSLLEFLDLLDAAREKYKPEDLPYTFIVPCLPGYGFSSGPSQETESTCETAAEAIEALMVGLGYGDGYIAQGGDLGSFIARILAARHSAKAVHINFAVMPPPADADMSKLNPIELQGVQRAGAWDAQGASYAREHGQRPATIGLVLSTTPLALLIWIGEKFLEWVDEPLPLDTILGHISLYWFTDTFPRAIYPYRQFFGPNADVLPLKHYINKPLGYSWFPKEIAPMPKDWVATTGDLVWYKQHDAGGHFAALERPRELLGDIEEFVGQVWKK